MEQNIINDLGLFYTQFIQQVHHDFCKSYRWIQFICNRTAVWVLHVKLDSASLDETECNFTQCDVILYVSPRLCPRGTFCSSCF